MIFKQIQQGISDIYVVGKKINKINKLKLDTTNITGYATALKGLSTKQAEFILLTKGLSAAQQKAILSETALLGTTGKLTTAELKAILVNRKRNKDQAEALLINAGVITSESAEAAATNVVTAAKLKELVQTKALTQAEADLIATKASVTLANQKESVSLLAGIGSKIKGAGTTLKGLGTGILTIASAHPVIAGITAAIALCSGAAIVNKVKQEKAAKAIKEAYEIAKTAIYDINNTFNENSSKTKEIAKEYAELAQGVDILTNKNKELSTEKYERFLDLSNQLSSLYPPLTKSYDENGNAILNLSGDVDTIVGSLDDLIESQRSLANQEIVEQMPDLFKGYSNNVADYEDELEKAKNTKNAIQSAYDEISKYGIYTAFDINGNATDSNGDPVALKLGQYIDLLKTLGITAKEVTLKDSMGQVIGYKIELEDGSDIPNLSGIHDAFVSAFNQAHDDVKYAQQQLDAERSSINQYLNTWLQNEFSYNQIEDNGLQKAIQDTLFYFDWSSLPEGIDKNDWDAVSEYLRRNILFSINNINDSEVSEAMANIYSGCLNSRELLNAIAKVQEYFGSEHPISVNLQTKVKDVEPLVNNVKEKLQDDFDGKVGELTLDELKIVAEQVEVPEGTLLTWDELIAEIKDVQSSTLNKYPISIPNTFSEAWSSIGTSGDETADKTALEAKEKLLELAEAGKLTIQEFSKSSLADYFKETGLSVDEVIEKINEMTSSASQLASMKAGISSITSILDEKKENRSSKETRNVGIGADTLNAMPDDIKAQTKEYNEFIKVLGDGESKMDECREAANDLAAAYVSSNNFLANLTDSEKDYYVSLLKEMGVKNAAKIVDDALTAKKQKQELKTQALEAATQDLTAATVDATDKTGKATDEFLKSANATKLARLELFELIATEKIFGNNDLSVDAKAKELNKLAEKYLGVSAAIQTSAMFADPRYYPDEESRQQAVKDKEKEIEDTYNKLIKNRRKLLFGDIDIDENAGGKKKDKKKSTDTDTNQNQKKSKQQFDWINRALDRLSSKLDLLKAKYENLFSNPKVNDSASLLKEQNKNLNEQYKILKKRAKYQEMAQKKYHKKANNVKLDDTSLKKAVREGRIKGSSKELIAEYGEKKAERIQQYQDWYDKMQEQEKTLESTKTAMHENRSQRIQNTIDYTESKRADLQAKRENAFSATDKNYYITDEINVVEDLYKYQIKLAKSEKDTLEVSRLKAEKEKEIRDLKAEQHQNNIDELESFLDLLSAHKENAISATEKISLTDRELETTRQIYAEKKAIANTPDEIDRLDEEFRSKEKQAVIDKGGYIKDEYNNRLDAIDRERSATKARIGQNEALGLGQSKRDYKEQIELSRRRQNELIRERDSLDSYLNEQISLGKIIRDESDPAYKQLIDSISECDSGIADCVTEQINYNSAIKDMDLKNYESLITLLERGKDVYNRYKTLAELHGSTLPDDHIYKQIDINNRIVSEIDESNNTFLDRIKNDLMYNYSDTLGFNFTEEQADEFIKTAKDSPELLAGFMKSQGIEDFNQDRFSKLFDNLDNYYNGVDKIYQKIEENENLVDEFFNNHIRSINEYIDSLKKEKDIKDRTFAIEKAQYELNKAKNNLTKKVWDGSQWIYTADTDAVQSAQEAYDNAQYEELVNVLEDLIEALEHSKEEVNLYDDYGNPIHPSDADTLKEILGNSLADILTSSFPLTFNIPDMKTPDFSNSSGNNSMNINKIEFVLPNINDKSSASDLTESFVNQLLNLPAYGKQYDWNK